MYYIAKKRPVRIPTEEEAPAPVETDETQLLDEISSLKRENRIIKMQIGKLKSLNDKLKEKNKKLQEEIEQWP